ncbi:MAG TPA: DUF5985 family protein [Longimicrobium sp.]|nr:DUF5985 family protein [Longimicrobium sp.]
MATFLAGAIAMAYLVAGLFFLKFWRRSGDRLFLAFSVSFALLAAQRAGLAALVDDPEAALPLYGVRALAFILILLAIIDKNRPGRD